MLTYYNFGNAGAQVAGGLVGAAILQLGGEAHAARYVGEAGAKVQESG